MVAQELLIKQFSVIFALVERVVVDVVSIGDVVEDACLVRVDGVLVFTLIEWVLGLTFIEREVILVLVLIEREVVLVLVNRVLVVHILSLIEGVLFIAVEVIKLVILGRGLLALFRRFLGGELELHGRFLGGNPLWFLLGCGLLGVLLGGGLLRVVTALLMTVPVAVLRHGNQMSFPQGLRVNRLPVELVEVVLRRFLVFIFLVPKGLFQFLSGSVIMMIVLLMRIELGRKLFEVRVTILMILRWPGHMGVL